MRDDFNGFLKTIIVCGDIRTEIVEYEICFLTSATWWITLVRKEVDVLIEQVSLVNALILRNLCEYRHK